MKFSKDFDRVEIESFVIENSFVCNYLSSLRESERDTQLNRAIYIGTLALQEDRLSAFLSKTTNELGTELENLKMLYDMNNLIFYKTTIKGATAEDDIANFLTIFCKEKKLNDSVFLTGSNAGTFDKNKSGDIICEIDGNANNKISIEVKYDKSLKLGSVELKDIFKGKSDTAWSQLIEAQANRESKVSLIIFDKAIVDNSILDYCENLGYIPGVGFVVLVDSRSGNYANLVIGYTLARDIVLNSKAVNLDKELLAIIIKRIIKDINDILTVKVLVESNIKNCNLIKAQLDKGLLLMEFNNLFLAKFLKDGKLSRKDLLDFYQGDEVKQKYKEIEQSIKNLTKDTKKALPKKTTTHKKTTPKKTVAKTKNK